MLAQQQQLNLIVYARYFITPVKINSYRLIAMVDSGATIVVDRNLLLDRNKRVDRETKSLPIAIQQYYEKLIFDIVRIATYDIVLEIF